MTQPEPKSQQTTITPTATLAIIAFLLLIVMPVIFALWQQMHLNETNKPVLLRPQFPSYRTPDPDTLKIISQKVPNMREGKTPAPRLYLRNLPPELLHTRNSVARKRLFIASLLPSILHVNEVISAKRAYLESLKQWMDNGGSLDTGQRKWLNETFALYQVENDDWAELFRRVDTIPPALALAQAAIESGWGTSRFAQQGNALYGQWTWKGTGMVPNDRAEGKTHRIKSFNHIMGSVRGYMYNLNTHPAYDEFRTIRAQAHNRPAEQVQIETLTQTLANYSERGQDYVISLNNIIKANRLVDFNKARLMSYLTQPPESPVL